MKIIYSEKHKAHFGAKEMRYDQMIEMSDSPQRIDIIIEGLAKAGFTELVQAAVFDIEVAKKIHSPDFIDFLQRAYPLWEQEFGPGGFATAYTFGMRGMSQSPNESVHSMLSCYTFDVCVPIVEGTWLAIRSAIDVVLSGVQAISQGDRAVLSLCRPPGHHASQDLAGGYCYMNNVAIAAQQYLDKGAKRVAILDVDYHHGNGTQRIFYQRSDVLFISLHARPEQEYPFLMGYQNEVGKGAGEGFNVNMPMPKGTAFTDYAKCLAQGLERVKDYQPDVLLISLGVDTYIDDPVGGFALVSEDYLSLGGMIGELQLPTHFVMEGGYAMDDLGTNVANVISGFSGE